jgi:hypothetical protein
MKGLEQTRGTDSVRTNVCTTIVEDGNPDSE